MLLRFTNHVSQISEYLNLKCFIFPVAYGSVHINQCCEISLNSCTNIPDYVFISQ